MPRRSGDNPTGQAKTENIAIPAIVRWVPPALFLSSAALIILAIATLRSGGRASGPGIYWVTLWLIGLAAALIGVELATPAGQSRLAQWRTLFTREHYAAYAKFGAILLQLILLLGIVRLFRVESPAFHDKIVALTIIGFALHYFLPLRHRLSFFLALSLSGILVVFGWTGAAWLIGVGLLLVAICHMPIAWGPRVGLLVVGGVLLALMRADVFSAPIPSAIWPILGSMFMFRLILYMYDLRHAVGPVDWRRTLSYFFLLPNVVFPLFPVVDWGMFRRTYYDTERHAIYQRGVHWMCRGVAHLLIYRLVYMRFAIAPTDVTGGVDLARFMVGSFLLYLRVSGQFHLIVGMLHLFGFRLPETHRFFFLASSFTDFWRRINIYWKDFMMKVVYYPAFFRLRRFGNTTAVIGATVMVFVGTWLLHAYQWFWLLGTFLLTWPDVLFWAILAFLLVVNSVVEMKRGRERTLSQARPTARQLGQRALQTAAFFAVMCVLWSLWSSDSIGEWLSLWSVVRIASIGHGARTLLLLVVSLFGFLAVAVGTVRIWATFSARHAPIFWPTVRVSTAILLLVYGAGHFLQTTRFGKSSKLIRELQTTQLNAADAARLQRGYYEELTAPNRANNALWEVFAGVDRNDRKPLVTTDLVRLTGEFLHLELKPGLQSRHRGVPFETNRWGMRDQDYDHERVPNTLRIAVLGQSYVLGVGVPVEHTFPKLLEQQLNRLYRARGITVEVMNFGMYDYQALQQLLQFKKTVIAFQPDVVLSIAHQSDIRRLPMNIIAALSNSEEIPLGFLRTIIDSAGFKTSMKRDERARRIAPNSIEIYRAVHELFAQECRQRGITPIWAMVPTPDVGERTEHTRIMQRIARTAGFHDVDLHDVYGPPDEARRFWVASYDSHPNAAGHQLIANRLFQFFSQHPQLLPTWPRSTRVSQPL